MLILISFFFSSLFIFNYIARISNDNEKPCPLSAAMCICMPWNTSRIYEAIEGPINQILFQLPVVKELCRVVKQNEDIFSRSFDVEDILKVC